MKNMNNNNNTALYTQNRVALSNVTVVMYDDEVDDSDGRIVGRANPEQYGSP